MDDKERSMLDEHQHFMKKILKAMISTFVIFLFSIYGILPLIGLAFGNDSSNTLFIISFCIGIIFTIFYCTFTIVDEIKNKK